MNFNVPALCTVTELAHIVQKPTSFVLVQMVFSTNLFSDAMIEHKEILLGQLFLPLLKAVSISCVPSVMALNLDAS